MARPAALRLLPGAGVAVLLVFALVPVSCGRAAAPSPRHLVLVTIDTLRADRLGCYGSTDVLTPHLDLLAREGAIAPQASAQVPLTRPSHVTIFTGLYPAEHGIRDNVSPSLAPAVPTLAEILRASGFQTAGFVSSIVVASQSGLGRGFDKYSDRFEVSADDARFLNTIQRRGDIPTAEAIAWIEARKPGRFFVWLHLYDPHDPYEPPEPYATRYAQRPYDGEVAWSDELVGRLEAALDRLSLSGETLLAVTSDHGEGLGEHGESVHGFFVYQATLHVPWLLRGPGIPPGARLSVTARSVDLVPTLLDLLGIPPPAGAHFSGRSLAPALKGRESASEQASYAESLLPLIHYGWSDLRTLREGRWKYILAPRGELYDLQNDPHELTNLAATEPTRAEALRAALVRRLESEKARVVEGQALAGIPADLLEKLGALGYVGAGGPPAGGTTGEDPKDKIEEFKVLNRLVREGLVRLREKDYAGSVERFSELLSRKVDSFEVHYYMGRALVGLGRPREASGHFATAARRFPAFGPAHLALADCRIAFSDLGGALEALRKGERESPKDPTLPAREAQVCRRLRKTDEARRAYGAALALSPRDPLLLVEFGELLRDSGDLGEAVRVLKDAVALDPETASYWNSLGRALGVKGDMAEAETAFREAARHDAGNAEYAYNVGLALLRQGRRREAVDFFKKSLDLDPRFAAPRERIAEIGSP